MSHEIKKAVSLYSYSEQWITQENFTFEDMFRHLHSLGVHTLEVVGSQTFSEYPVIPEAEVQELLALCEKYDMEFYCYDGYTDHGKIWDHDLTEEEILQEMTYDIMSAKRLGCKLMKSGIPAPFLHKVLPIAEMFDIKLCVELHAPEYPGNDHCQEYARTIRELNTDRIGLCPDFGMFILKPNDIMVQQYRNSGVPENILNYIIENRFNGDTEDSMWEKVKVMGGDDNAHLAVSEMFGFLSWSRSADFEGLKSILPYCIYFHGKFYHIGEDCVETTIPYRELLTIIAQSGYDGYIATEYEGHAFCLNDALEQIGRHLQMEDDILETL